jgi:hypothetical protein
LEVKIETIQRNQPGKEHVECLLLTLEIISEDKAALLGGVTMEIDIDPQVSQLLLLDNGLLGLINCRLLLCARIQVKSIQVVIMGVQAVVASSNTIWV